MDLSKYNLEKEDLELVIYILIAFSHHEEMKFEYKGKKYNIEYEQNGSGRIAVFENEVDSFVSCFCTAEDFFEKFILDGKPFIVRIGELDSFSI